MRALLRHSQNDLPIRLLTGLLLLVVVSAACPELAAGMPAGTEVASENPTVGAQGHDHSGHGGHAHHEECHAGDCCADVLAPVSKAKGPITAGMTVAQRLEPPVSRTTTGADRPHSGSDTPSREAPPQRC